jgi:polar amino acid transport system substrate-binding protein
MLRSLSRILLLFFISFPALASDPLEVEVEDAAAPWSAKDGTGYANEVVIAAFRAADVEIKLVVVPYARCKHDVLKGKIAACFNMSPDPVFKNTVRFSEKTLFEFNSDYFYNIKHPVKATSEDQIPKGVLVGIVYSYEYSSSLEKLIGKGVVFSQAATEEANLKKLALGRIDLAVVNINKIKPIEKMLKDTGAEGKVAFAFHGGRLQSFIGFSQRHARGDWARQKFDQGLRLIQQNGTLHQIETKWTPSGPNKS